MNFVTSTLSYVSRRIEVFHEIGKGNPVFPGVRFDYLCRPKHFGLQSRLPFMDGHIETALWDGKIEGAIRVSHRDCSIVASIGNNETGTRSDTFINLIRNPYWMEIGSHDVRIHAIYIYDSDWLVYDSRTEDLATAPIIEAFAELLIVDAIATLKLMV
jgi:hypothetical protein